jgi:DNA-binding PadR family transcriptional regulator
LTSSESAEPRSPSAAFRVHQHLRTAWLLHLLDEHPAYGYELERQLETIGLSAKLPVMYRTLRDLERNGRASSTWTHGGPGPRRRVYELTPAGRKELDEITARIAIVRDLQDTFLGAYEQARRPPAP